MSDGKSVGIFAFATKTDARAADMSTQNAFACLTGKRPEPIIV